MLNYSCALEQQLGHTCDLSTRNNHQSTTTPHRHVPPHRCTGMCTKELFSIQNLPPTATKLTHRTPLFSVYTEKVTVATRSVLIPMINHNGLRWNPKRQHSPIQPRPLWTIQTIQTIGRPERAYPIVMPPTFRRGGISLNSIHYTWRTVINTIFIDSNDTGRQTAAVLEILNCVTLPLVVNFAYFRHDSFYARAI